MVILTRETRFLSLETAEIRVKKTEKGRIIEGLAARFDSLSQDLGGFVEKIDKKAFDRCLKRCDVRGLKNHDPNKLLGRTGSGTMRLSVRDDGLWYEIDAPNTTTGNDTIEELERGDIPGSSFSFTLEPDGDDWDDETDPPTRTLLNVRDLFDVGPVAYPAYLGTNSSVRAECRSYQQFLESRELSHRGQAQQVQRLRILKLRLGHSILERGISG